MSGLDADIGSSALRLWVAAGSAALLVFTCALAFDWTRTRTVARVTVVVIGAVLGATMAWAFLNTATVRDQAAERRALEARASELNAQALAAGSPLACLDGLAGERVEAACEKALFAAPATVASASTYVAARYALLSDMLAYVRRGGGNIDSALIPLQRALEIDRFGFVAHLLAMRDGCTSDNNCKALALLPDPSRVRANLSGHTLDRYLDHYRTAWTEAPNVPVADAAPTMAMPASTGEAPPRKSVLNIDFPSANSIPAVSIMNPEPKGGTPSPAAAAAAVAAGAQSSAKVVGPQQMPPMPVPPSATASQSSPAKGKRKQAANPPPQTAPQAAAPVDPVWAAGAALASPQGAPSQPTAGAAAARSAPASSASSGGVPLAGMPVPLSPPPSQGNGTPAAQ
jgi:hypothetical protein